MQLSRMRCPGRADNLIERHLRMNKYLVRLIHNPIHLQEKI